MSNMNGRTRKRLYGDISKRDGEYCKCCGKLPSEGQLVIDHRNNNNSNNSMGNLQLLCRACNYLKNPRRPLDMCVSSNVENESVKINRTKEPKFRKYIYEQIDERDFIKYDEAIYSGAEVIEISPETAKRYIRKMCSEEGDITEFRFKSPGADPLFAKPILGLKYKE